MRNSLATQDRLHVNGREYAFHSLPKLGERFDIARLPQGCNLRHILAVSVLCGIGFTMSLFIGGLAFAGLEVKAFDERLGIVLGSIVAGIIGYVYLNKVLPKSNDTVLLHSRDHTFIPSDTTQQ